MQINKRKGKCKSDKFQFIEFSERDLYNNIMDVKTLGELCNIVAGGTPSRSNVEFWENGTIPWIKIGNIKGKYVQAPDEFITQKGLDNSSAKMLPKGTVLYTIFATLGEVGILNIDACTNQAIAGLTIKDEKQLNTDYLYYYLMSKKTYVNTVGRGVAQNNINMSILRSFKLPLLPICEQKKIVKILDKVNDLRNGYQLVINSLDNLIKARFVEMFGEPRINPNKYPTKMIKDTCIVITGNTPSRKVDEYYGDAIEWIKTDNIVSGLLYPTVASESLSDSGKAVGRTVDAGAVLMACIAGSVASIGRVCITDREVAFNQQINAIVPKEYDVRFLHALLQISKDYLVEDINIALKGIMSKSKLEEKEFIVPSMEEQVGFAEFVEQVDKSKFGRDMIMNMFR